VNHEPAKPNEVKGEAGLVVATGCKAEEQDIELSEPMEVKGEAGLVDDGLIQAVEEQEIKVPESIEGKEERAGPGSALRSNKVESSAGKPGLSTYEQIREDNIRRNTDFLASLGLDSARPAASQSSSKPRGVHKKRARSPQHPSIPARRSSRVAGLSIAVDYSGARDNNLGDGEGGDDKEEEEEEEEDEFDTPDVVKYILTSEGGDADYSAKMADLLPPTEVQRLQYQAAYGSLGLVRDDPVSTADLPAIYSLSFLSAHNHSSSSPAPLALLAAGKSGMVTIFNDPLGQSSARSVQPYSFQAHSRWVSTARFLDSSFLSAGADSASMNVGTIDGKESGVAPHMLPIITASDDATVKIWDVGRAGKKKPKLLSSSNQLHNRGIFSLEVAGDTVVCGSKDKTVTVSKITPGGLSSQPLARYALHSGVVKAVDVQSNGAVFASGSQDRSVCIKDTRVGSTQSAEVELTDCFGGGVFSVQFGPSNEGSQHLLLTAGLDPVIKLFDLRYVKGSDQPLHAYRGHTAPGVRLKSIVPPSFLGGHTIVTGGQGSSRLSLYCAKTGKTLSRGELPDDPSNCAVSIGPHGAVVAAACRGDVYFLRAHESGTGAGAEGN
jgi:WD40 repeat protein